MTASVSRRELDRFAGRLDKLRVLRQGMAMEGMIDPSQMARSERELLAGAVTEKMRRRGLQSHFFFCKHILGYGDMAKMHEELCSFTTKRTKKGRLRKRMLILEPRGSFKSSVVTIGYALWRVVQDPNIRILIDSEEFGKSKAFMRETKNHIEGNDLFRECYGELDARKNIDIWTEALYNVAPRTSGAKEPTFSAAGIDVTKVGMHYDVIIADDLVSDKNVTTREQIEKVIQHYKLLLSLLEPDGQLIIIGTRWDYGDLYGWLLERDEERVRKGKKPRWKKLIRSAINDDGSLLFPEVLTRNFLDAQLEEQGSYIFSCQYLNHPAGVEGAAFKPEWVKWTPELPKVALTFHVILDPSVGQKDDSDYSALIPVAADPLNNWYVLPDIVRERMNPTEIIDATSRLRMHIRDTFGEKPRVGMETVAFQRVLEFWAKDLMRRREIERFRVHLLKTDTGIPKKQRIRQIVPQVERGKLFFVGDPKKPSHGQRILLQEMEWFPRGSTVDCLDALAYMPQMVALPREDPLPEPEKTIFQRIKEDAAVRGQLGRRAPSVGSRIKRRKGPAWARS